MPGGEPVFKFSGGLLDQLHQVDIGNVQLDVAGAGSGGFYQILRQRFQSLGLLIQDLQILLNRRILDIFPLKKIHVIDDGGQRRLDIMGYVGDQIRLQPFAFYLFGQGRFQAVADPV